MAPKKTKKGKLTTKHHSFATESSGKVAKTKKPKLKYSNYYFTVNTNHTVKTVSRKTFAKGFRKVFDHIDEMIDFKSGNMDDVESIKVSTHPEIGKAKGLVHGHALVKIRHRAKVALPYSKIREALEEAGVVNPAGYHFYSKLVRDNVGNVTDYMNKTHKDY